MGDVAPLVILAHRIVWSAPTAAVLIIAAGKRRDLFAALLNPQIVFALFASSIAIAANWSIYIWAVTSGHILQGSLGYYINPLISFALAALFFAGKNIYRPAQACKPGEVCALPQTRRLYKILFWISSVLTLLALVYPYLAKYFY